MYGRAVTEATPHAGGGRRGLHRPLGRAAPRDRRGEAAVGAGPGRLLRSVRGERGAGDGAAPKPATQHAVGGDGGTRAPRAASRGPRAASRDPGCPQGRLVGRRTRATARPFYSGDRYPVCRFTTNDRSRCAPFPTAPAKRERRCNPRRVGATNLADPGAGAAVGRGTAVPPRRVAPRSQAASDGTRGHRPVSSCHGRVKAMAGAPSPQPTPAAPERPCTRLNAPPRSARPTACAAGSRDAATGGARRPPGPGGQGGRCARRWWPVARWRAGSRRGPAR